MSIGWPLVLLWFAVAGGGHESGRRGDAGVVRVASALGAVADRVIARQASKHLPETIVQIESLPPERLRDRLYGPGREGCDLLLGAPVELLTAPTARKRLVPYQPSWARSLPPSCRERRGLWHAPWLEPLVIGYSRAGLMGALGSRSLPRDYSELGAPRWEGQVTLPEPVPYTVGAFVVLGLMERAQREQGDIGPAIRSLTEMDANLPTRESGAPDYARRIEDCVDRLLDRSRPELLGVIPLAAVVSRAARGELGWISPATGTLAWPRCLALIAPDPGSPAESFAAACAVVEMLGDPDVASRVADALHAVSARELTASEGVSGVEWRFSVDGEGAGEIYPTDSLAIGRDGPAWLARFETEVRGQVRSRYATFDAAFEWLGMIILLGTIGFMALKAQRGPGAD